MEPDASDLVIAAVLSQYHPVDTGGHVLHPVAYHSRKMTSAECNYGIGDTELLAIVDAFEEWRPLLYGAKHTVMVLSDHLNLRSFASRQKLNRRQARWAGFLQDYDLCIEHRPGRQNGKADALTRRPEDAAGGRQEGIVLPSSRFAGTPIENSLSQNPFPDVPGPLVSPISLASSFHRLAAHWSSAVSQGEYQAACEKDPLVTRTIEMLEAESGSSRPPMEPPHQRSSRLTHPSVDLAQCAWDPAQKKLYFDERLWIPNSPELQAKLTEEAHDAPMAGHHGIAATFERLSRRYWWPHMRQFVSRYIKNYDTCCRPKAPRHRPYGLLRPLEVPVKRWTSIAMDFVSGLPLSQDHDAILVVVDRLTKMSHFLPLRFGTHENPYPEDPRAHTPAIARLLRDRVVVLHGMPASIISDRDPRFTSDLARQLCKVLRIRQDMSTAAHSETDDQSERTIQTLQQYLRAYVSYQQTDWPEWLALAEFSYNNTVSATTQMTPFFAKYSYHPDLYLDPDPALVAAGTPPADLEADVAKLRKLQDYLKAEITFARDVYKETADRRRQPSPTYKPGHYVWLLSRHIRTTRPCRKLDHKRLGRFKVVKRVGTHAYRLELPATMKIHPVFHVSLLEPCASNPLPGQL